MSEGKKQGIFVEIENIGERRIWSAGDDGFSLITGFGGKYSGTWAGDGYTESNFSISGDVMLLNSHKTIQRDGYSNFQSKEVKVGKRFARCSLSD